MKQKEFNTKKNFFKRLSEYVEQRNLRNSFCEDDYIVNDGVVVLPISVNADDMYDARSTAPRRDLNPDIYEYVEKQTYFVPVTYPIRLQVSGNLDANQKQEFSSLYHRRYELEFRDKNVDHRAIKLKSLALLILGAILLVISFAVSAVYEGKVLTEFLYIAATFAMWECVDFWLLERNEANIAKLNAAQLALTEIVFD